MKGRRIALLVVACGAVGAVQCALLPDLGSMSGGTRAGDGGTPVGDGAPAGDGAPGGDGGTSNAYRTMVMADGPIGYWRLGDPTSPAAKDEVPNGHDGVYSGGVALGEPGALAGDPNTAARFDGADDRLKITLPSNFDFAAKAPFSVEAWVKRTSAKLGILSKGVYGADAGGYAGWFLVYNAQNTEVEFFRSGSSLVSTTAPPNDAFFHVVATFDGVTLLLFVNGQQVASAANQKDMAATTGQLIIGYGENWGTYQGVIDEVAVYDKPLPPPRVKAHYDAAK